MRLEQLETRALLAVMVGPLTGTEGFPISGQIAKFADTDVQGSPQASIAWGDGHTTAGTILSSGTNFTVDGSNTFAVPGTYPVTVTVIGTGGSTATGQGQATISAIPLLATGTTITPVPNQPFTGVVASFSDPYPRLTASGHSATIAWGDGSTSIGTIAAHGGGGFNVTGTNTYAAAGTVSVTVTVTRLVDNQSATATTNSVVVSSRALSGQLDPLSDTGVSSTDGITAINHPSFFGTAMKYAVIQFYGRRTDQAQPILLGQAVADATGAWNFSVGALPDGTYNFTVAQIPTNGPPTQMALLTPVNVIIDTVAPTAVSTVAHPSNGWVTIVFKDNLSGLDRSAIANPANYALVLSRTLRIHPKSATIVPSATVAPNDPVAVTLQFSALPRHRTVDTIALGGITDLAGNGLATQYVHAPAAVGGDPRPSSSRPAARLRNKMLRV
jgi:hypothetical protein